MKITGNNGDGAIYDGGVTQDSSGAVELLATVFGNLNRTNRRGTKSLASSRRYFAAGCICVRISSIIIRTCAGLIPDCAESALKAVSHSVFTGV